MSTRSVSLSLSATVQVKTLQGHGEEWLLSKPDEESKGEQHFYVLVRLNGLDAPEYFIAAGKRVAKACRERHAAYISSKKRDGTPRKDTAMRTFCPEEGDKGAWHLLAKAIN